MRWHNRINIMCPTTGRAHTKLPEFVDSALATAENIDNLVFTFCVNERDDDTVNYLHDRFINNLDKLYIVKENLPAPNLAVFFNLMYEQTRWKDYGTLVSMTGDDFVFKTQGWDRLFLDTMNDKCGYGIVYGDDAYVQHEALCVYFVTSRQYVEMTGHPFMCELFPLDWIDNIWMETARRCGAATYLPNLVIEHKHVSRRDVDRTYITLRKQADVAGAQVKQVPVEVEKRVDHISKCNAALDTGDIAFIMPTYNRVDLLRGTVRSWNDSLVLPQKIRVYDDGSTDVRVQENISRMTGSVFIPVRHTGCDSHIYDSITNEFHRDDRVQAVFVIDSDTAFSGTWYLRLLDLWQYMCGHQEYVLGSIFNTANHKAIGDLEYGLIEKLSVGGFGMLVTRKAYERGLMGYDRKAVSKSWDNFMRDNCAAAGLKCIATVKSWLQHTGWCNGIHVSTLDKVDIAEDYVGEHVAMGDKPKMPDEPQKILFSCMARHGDIISASPIANMLIAKRHRVCWLTIPKYGELVSAVCPGASIRIVVPDDGEPQSPWFELSTYQMKERFPGYALYLNAQIGSRENHDVYLRSGKHPCVWLRDMVETQTGWTLAEDIAAHFTFAPKQEASSVTWAKPMCLIAPHAHTAKNMDPKLVADLTAKYEADGYLVRYLCEKRPQEMSNRERQKWIFGQTFVETIALIQQASVFIGRDSGLAWAAVYSKAKSFIYHDKERVKKVNTWFSKINPNAEDVVIGEDTHTRNKVLFYYTGMVDHGEPMAGTAIGIARHAACLVGKVNVAVTGDRITKKQTVNGVEYLPLNEGLAYADGADLCVLATDFGAFKERKKGVNQKWLLWHNCWLPRTETLRRDSEIALHLALSDIHRKNLIANGIPEAKCRVMTHYVDGNLFKPMPAERAPRSVLYAGAVVPYKRVDEIADVVVANGGHLSIVGGARLWNDSDEYENRLRDNKSIRWFGVVDNDIMPEIYCVHDVVVLNSELESFSLVAAEAILCGCVPVVRNTGGLSAVVQDGVNGILFDSDMKAAIGDGFSLCGSTTAEDRRKTILNKFCNPNIAWEVIRSVL